MAVESDEPPAEMVHVEWWHDLDRPFFADASLLSARSSYPTSISTDDGVFDATVLLPQTVDTQRALANFLAPPCDWGAVSSGTDEAWGTHYRRQQLGVEGVVVKRLAFECRADSGLVKPGVRELWGQVLLPQQILLNMDRWWDTVRTWLEIATNQRLAPVGYEHGDALDATARTSVWTVEDGGDREPYFGPRRFQSPERVIGVNPDILQDCLALAGTTPSVAWTLLRDARALQNARQLRRSVIDAATAAELAVTQRLDDLTVGESQEKRDVWLEQTLGRKGSMLADRGYPLPGNFQAALVDRRNQAVHKGLDLSYEQWEAGFRVALALVEDVFPLPTAPGSSRPLTCYWDRASRPVRVESGL